MKKITMIVLMISIMTTLMGCGENRDPETPAVEGTVDQTTYDYMLLGIAGVYLKEPENNDSKTVVYQLKEYAKRTATPEKFKQLGELIEAGKLDDAKVLYTELGGVLPINK